MTQTRITLKMNDGECEAWEVKSHELEKRPAVLMYMDALGIRPTLLELAQRIADQGYFVLVPNLFYRKHKVPLMEYPEKFNRKELSETILPKLKPWINDLNPTLMQRDASVYIRHLLKHNNVHGDHVNIIGYCFGGGHAVRTAAQFPEVRSVVSLHGGQLASDLPESPHLYLDKIDARLYFGHADHDQSMPLPMIEKLEKALEDAGNDYVSKIFTGAHHGFSMRDFPSYDEIASEDAFRATIMAFK